MKFTTNFGMEVDLKTDKESIYTSFGLTEERAEFFHLLLQETYFSFFVKEEFGFTDLIGPVAKETDNMGEFMYVNFICGRFTNGAKMYQKLIQIINSNELFPPIREFLAATNVEYLKDVARGTTSTLQTFLTPEDAIKVLDNIGVNWEPSPNMELGPDTDLDSFLGDLLKD
jgi:hypothetical protein